MIRVFASGLRIHLMQLVRSPFDIVAMLVWPVIFASIAYYLIGVDAQNSVLFTASLGAAVMMMWSQVIVGSGFALDQQRNQGTLELLVAAPVPLVTVIAPIMIASGAFGIYGLLVTLAWGRLAFAIPLDIADPAAFVAAAAVSILAIGLLGMIAASLFVLSRAASYLGVALQYPVYLASGLLVPLAILPAWLGPISWILAPTWGYRALTHSANGESAWPEIGMCVLLSGVYIAIALPCLAWFERLARDRASLRLS
jgi:ABC-2 type transport system permease protein